MLLAKNSRLLIIDVILVVLFALVARPLRAETVSAIIVSSINEEAPNEHEIITRVNKAGLIRIIGLAKIEFTTKPKPITYLLEWTYHDGEGEKVLDSYKKNKYLRFTTKSDKFITYYWVTKRISSVKTGKYYFKIYNEDEKLEAKAVLIVGGSE